ncbi:MAG: lipid II:glycine glycyltransferase FemX [Microbacter sp.]
MTEVQSTMILTDQLEAIDRHQWSLFVAAHPNGTFFQTPEYVELHQGVKGFTTHVFVAYTSDQKKMIGVLVAVRQYVYGGIARYLTSRVIVAGGPLVDVHYPEAALLLLREMKKTMRFRAVYSEFRNLFDMTSMHSAFMAQKAIFEDHLDILIDLQKAEEVLWNEVRPKRRNAIRHAQKQSVEVRELSTDVEREASWRIIQRLYRREKLPLAPKAMFDRAFAFLVPKGMLKIYGAFHQGQLIGTRYILAYKTILYDWYAGSDASFYALRPNDVMPWIVFVKGKAEGFTQFDFGGAGKPSIPYGVRDYKKSFGGTMVNYGRYALYHNKPLFVLMQWAFRLWQRFQ